MIPNPSIEVQTSPVDRPSVPAWFAEVVILSQHLATKGVLEAFAHHVRLARGRFGDYEPLDFLALLIGYAISGERTFSDFFHRLAPFGTAFMALFGRADLPHRASTLVVFWRTSTVPAWKPFANSSSNTILLRSGPQRQSVGFGIGRGATASSLTWMPPAKRHGSERCPLIQHCFPLDVDSMRSARQATRDAQRGEIVRTRTVALQMHTRQWIGTYAGRGSGDYQGEL
jgi:hypothetical protein